MNLDAKSVDTIRILSADAIQKANSGHPGLPLGSAPMAYELWMNHLSHNPRNPHWSNRDRFVLSGGHGSALLYALLHLFGYGGLSADDLRQFRQLNSKTPGHPEYGHTVGVEATTGPLGAGMGMAVGMAMAEAHLAAVFNTEEFPVVDHYTYVLSGDGCLMEGISSEACSLAGTLGLSKLIILYDSNRISIEGSTDLAFQEDVAKRFEAFGFQTLTVEDGNDLAAIGRAIEQAKADHKRPSLITIHTEIGYGCPAKQGKASAHGEPLGEENVAALRQNIGWEYQEPFFVPEEIYAHFAQAADRLAQKEQDWHALFEAYGQAYPEKRALWERYHAPVSQEALLQDDVLWDGGDQPQATRSLSGQMMNRLKELMPNFIGGAADLAPSTKVTLSGAGDFSKDNYQGRNIHFGVRELAMGAIGNGMMLHGGLHAFVSTFFVFSDYLKPMARLSALMKLPLVYVLSHDSIGVGEDGPTHEPIEQLTMFRAMPGFTVFRPADANETAAGWVYAVTADRPTALVLSRQNLPQLPGSGKQALQGGYILADCQGTPDGILLASGSEVSLALEAQQKLAEEGFAVRVVSMPSMELFAAQPLSYRETVLPKEIRARVAVEAGSPDCWYRYVGLDGAVIGLERFGASAPADQLFEQFGFTADHVVQTFHDVLGR